MSRVATRRLLAASATLDAADRALLNMWMHRGLDDGALARMTGLHEAAVDARRDRIVTHLSATLGLPPETIRGTLDEIAASPPATVPPDADPAAPPPSGRTPYIAASAAEEIAGDSASRRRGWLVGLPLIAIVVAVIFITSLGSGGSGHPTGDSPRRATAAAQGASPVSPSPASSSPATTTRSPDRRLVALPGGPAHATGTALVTGTRAAGLRLYLTVSHLPAASHGHYEIWLYDSIIYARDLGRLPNGVSHLTLRLPPNARRFRWIDISFQPPGAVFHSGDSLLRSPNSLFGGPARADPS